MAKKTQRAQVDPGEAESFRKTAEQFMKAGKLAREHGYGNAAGLLFVHAAIAYADAVSIRLAGMKSTSDNHHDAVQLLSEREHGVGLQYRQEQVSTHCPLPF